MLETLLGGLLGGTLRLVPEFLKWLDRAGERKHELLMQDKALEFEKLRGASRLAELGSEAEKIWTSGAFASLQNALAGQGKKSGIRWIDALSISVRPIITYWFMLIYCGTKVSLLAVTFLNGGDLEALARLAWTRDDMVIWSGMLNFWFLGRVFDKVGRG